MKRLNVAVGVVATGLVVAVVSRVADWMPGVVLGAAVVLTGLLVAWHEKGKSRRS